jgi:hypothetical protein
MAKEQQKNLRFLARIVDDIEKLLNIEAEIPEEIDPDADPYIPAKWWLPKEEEE